MSRFRAKRGQLKRFWGFLPSQGSEAAALITLKGAETFTAFSCKKMVPTHMLITCTYPNRREATRHSPSRPPKSPPPTRPSPSPTPESLTMNAPRMAPITTPVTPGIVLVGGPCYTDAHHLFLHRRDPTRRSRSHPPKSPPPTRPSPSPTPPRLSRSSPRQSPSVEAPSPPRSYPLADQIMRHPFTWSHF